MLIKFQSDPALQNNQEVYNRLLTLFSGQSKITEATIGYMYDKIHNTIIWHKCNLQVRKMFGELNKYEDTNDPLEQRSYLDNILNSAHLIQAVFAESPTAEQGLVEHIDFTNVASIKASYNKFHDRKETSNLRLGLQGLNRMFGRGGGRGPALGESVIFNALSHNYKSGILMSIAKWIVKYNEPPKHIGGKKPMILFISLENEAFENLMWWFRSTYELIAQTSADGIPEEQIIQHTYDYFNSKGYTFIVERYLPSEFGYDDLIRVYNKYESSGYYVIATIIDYMNSMRKGDSNSGKIGNYLLVKELYSNTCNFTKSKGTSLFTAHQLTKEAGMIAINTVDAVKKFSDVHMSHSSDIFREIDTSINMHLETNLSGDKFWTAYRNKRRYDDVTPEIDKYTAYKFTKFGIPDDVDGPDMSVKNIYATESHTKNAVPQKIGDLF